MGRGPSWRLQFIDIDSSFTITTSNSDIIGYMVVRAPKGEEEGYFFPAGNTSAIEAMIGIPTADWPDIGEAEAFNAEYGLYVSAPPGTSADYPSYYGGLYLTSVGEFPFYKVTDKSEPGYIIGIKSGAEKDFDDTANPVQVTVALSDMTDANNPVQGTIMMSGISPAVYDKLNKIDFNYWGNGTYAPKGTYTYKVEKTDGDGFVAKLFCLDSDGVAVKVDGTPVCCGFIVETIDADYNTTYTAYIGKAAIGDNATTNSNKTSGIPYIDFSKMGISVLTKLQSAAAKNVTYRKVSASDTFSSTTTYFVQDPTDTSKYITTTVGAREFAEQIDTLYVAEASKDSTSTSPDQFKQVIVGGDDGSFGYSLNGVKGTIGKSVTGIKARLTECLYVKDITYMYFVQKSATEKVTRITIDNVGYDKYVYDTQMPWTSDSNLTPSYSMSKGKTFLYITKDANDNILAKVYQSQGPVKAAGTTPTDAEKKAALPVDVTSDYLTQVIRATGTDLAVETNSEYLNAFFYVDADGGQVQTVDGEYPLKLAKNIAYNTLSISCSEQVYPGAWKSGGTFTGSLDEEGVDSSGSNIYWLNVLPDDSLSFIEVVVNKTFDDDLNNGCFTKERLSVGKELSLQGQRYVTHIVEENVENGINGCATNENAFYTVIKSGWTDEAMKTMYDACYVFMEPTGYESLKSTLASLRKKQKLSTVISPKIIQKPEFLKPETIAVAGRLTGTAQYVGEFQIKDPYTGRKYWCQPIGDVGVNLCRIIEAKYGAWAPMWNNITGGLGGQLNRAVLKAKWDFSDDATKILDEKGLNPIIYNASDGLMIVSQKTTQDPTNLTDWSYLGHTMAFDLLKREIRDNVMRPQIGKPNDSYWQAIRQDQVDAILAKRITGSQPVWTAATCDIAGVNTDIVKAQRKFCIYVKVKVTVFSEIVELTLENVAQTTNL